MTFRVITGRGVAWQGLAWRGEAKRGIRLHIRSLVCSLMTFRVITRHGSAGHGRARRGETRRPFFLINNEVLCMTTTKVQKSNASDTRLQIVTRQVKLKGIQPIMFDRYAGDNKTKLNWNEKVYLAPGTNQLIMPTINLSSFLSAHNTNSAPKRLRDKRAYKDICNACLSFVQITALDGSQNIPFTSNGNLVQVGSFGESLDEQSGIYLHRAVARLEKGIPNPKERPVLPCPWELEFNLTIFPNKEIKEPEIKNLIEEGGIAIGLGTFRGVFGKFMIEEWS